MARGAIFSDCGTFRYALMRVFTEAPAIIKTVAFIGLNPSIADAVADDHTIRRSTSFAKAWGYDAMIMLNLFAFRATDPAEMKREIDPVGPENDYFLKSFAENCDLILACWGSHGGHLGRDAAVVAMLDKPLHCLGTTTVGAPRHPARLPGGLRPEPFEMPPAAA